MEFCNTCGGATQANGEDRTHVIELTPHVAKCLAMHDELIKALIAIEDYAVMHGEVETLFDIVQPLLKKAGRE
jgi:hypothetical protein